MNVHVNTARRHDQAAGRVISGIRPAHQVLVNTILDVGIAGFTNARDLTVAHANISFDNTQHRIDDGGVFN